jgi:hypothetical protein
MIRICGRLKKIPKYWFSIFAELVGQIDLIWLWWLKVDRRRRL